MEACRLPSPLIRQRPLKWSDEDYQVDTQLGNSSRKHEFVWRGESYTWLISPADRQEPELVQIIWPQEHQRKHQDMITTNHQIP